ncbi:MAG: glycosyltransferase family 4 protein [Clostridia bacterium]|nr:glycosyltransferase family 4 protein [Deltaproteobacteria bacterium]
MRAVILYPKLGPLHAARLIAAHRYFAARGNQLECIEVASEQSDYPWRSTTELPELTLRTLFPNRDYRRLKRGETVRAVHRAMSAKAYDAAAIVGWAMTESWAALAYCVSRNVARVCITDTQYGDNRHFYKPVVEQVKRIVVRAYDAAFVGGRSSKRYIVELGMPEAMCTDGCDVIDNAVFASVEPDFTPTSLRFMTAARLIAVKNIPATVQRLARLEMPWEWTIAGHGSEHETIERVAAACGVRDRIHLVGAVDYANLGPHFAAANVYLQPSTSEPWGLAINDAMAAGLPVLASTQCGCQEDLIRDNGFTFDAHDAPSFVRAVEAAWSARKRWKQMGSASRTIIANWSLERFARNLHEACRLAVERRRARWSPWITNPEPRAPGSSSAKH